MSASSSSPPRRWRLPLRFSLRMLLLAVTAFAIGFPVWYRWPYEESVEERDFSSLDPFVPRGAKPPLRTVVTTWQRQWGGRRLKHGSERMLRNGELVSLVTYKDGELHGPCEYHERNGAREVGQLANGKRDGVWKRLDRNDRVVRTTTWRDDLLDGLCETMFGDGSRLRLEYAAGRLVMANGSPVRDRLGELLAENKIDSAQVQRALSSTTDIEFVDTPLKDAAEFLADKHGVPIVLDPHYVARERTISGDWQGVQLTSALTIMTAISGHACDYRYGCIWITSVEDVKDWRDPTGVAEIQPPKDSQLAASWNEPVDIETIETPLADALAWMTAQLAIGLDMSAIQGTGNGEASYPVTQRAVGIPFRHALGIFLYHTRCRCKLDGETLVILPPESAAAAPKP